MIKNPPLAKRAKLSEGKSRKQGHELETQVSCKSPNAPIGREGDTSVLPTPLNDATLATAILDEFKENENVADGAFLPPEYQVKLVRFAISATRKDMERDMKQRDEDSLRREAVWAEKAKQAYARGRADTEKKLIEQQQQILAAQEQMKVLIPQARLACAREIFEELEKDGLCDDGHSLYYTITREELERIKAKFGVK